MSSMRARVWLGALLFAIACAPDPERALEPVDAEAQIAPASWQADMQQRTAHGEQAIRPHEGAYRAVNRAHDLVARFERAGAVRVSRREREGELSLRFAGIGREDDLSSATVIDARLGACRSDGALDERGDCLRRLELERERGVLEWWENRDEGLEQGFTLSERVAGRGELAVRVAVQGARVELASPRAAELVLDDGARLAYAGLRAWDARGRELDARFTADASGTLTMRVDDAGARYPITIDPVLSASTAWTAESNQASAFVTSV